MSKIILITRHCIFLYLYTKYTRFILTLFVSVFSVRFFVIVLFSFLSFHMFYFHPMFHQFFHYFLSLKFFYLFFLLDLSHLLSSKQKLYLCKFIGYQLFSNYFLHMCQFYEKNIKYHTENYVTDTKYLSHFLFNEFQNEQKSQLVYSRDRSVLLWFLSIWQIIKENVTKYSARDYIKNFMYKIKINMYVKVYVKFYVLFI